MIDNEQGENQPALNFSVDSQLLGELGEKLVTKHYIALSELIKNSYDADASSVTVKLINSSKTNLANGSEIRITDNGTGMSFSDVESMWMRIATNNKSDNPVSVKFGRDKTGNKGIGRFACQRLGATLVLETIAKVGRRYQQTIVTFEWDKFKPGLDVSKIPCNYSTEYVTGKKPGLTLKIKNLRKHWTSNDFLQLKKEVSLLSVVTPIRREGFEEDPGFEIFTTSEEFGDDHQNLGENLLSAGWGSLKATVNDSGKINLSLNAKGIGNCKYSIPDSFPNLTSGVNFTLHFLPHISTNEMDTRRKPRLLTKGIQKQLLDEQSGVKVYLNGFRVYPYGSEESDWLSIERDVSRRKATHEHSTLKDLANSLNVDSRKALLGRASERNLIGSVSIPGGPHSPFSVKMDREGLVENAAYLDLVNAIKYSLEWMALQFALSKKKISEQVSKQKEVALFQELTEASEAQLEPNMSTSDKVKHVLDLITADSDSAPDEPIQEAASTKPAIANESTGLQIPKKVKEYVTSHISAQDDELAFLRSIAATGPVMFAFAHEVKNVTGLLVTNARFLQGLSEKTDDKNLATELSKVADEFLDSKSRFDHMDNLFGVFAKSYEHKKSPQYIVKSIDTAVKGFEFLLTQFNIDIEVKCNSKLLKTIPMRQGELYAIVVNLISNAIKACMAKNTSKNSILLEVIDKSENGISIICSDTGVGLSKSYWESVFEPLVSDPEDKIYNPISLTFKDEALATLGRGSGMGLNIVKGILEAYKGKAKFISPKGRWNTSILVDLPKR